MSISYIFFTELKQKGKWYCINPNALVIDSEKHYKLIPTLESHASRGFEPVYNKISENAQRIEVTELSDNLRSSLEELNLSHKDYVLTVDIETLEKCCEEKPVEYSGFALRSEVRDFENGIEDDIYEYVTAAEYRVMDRELKKAYRYYEWNQRFGWFEYFKKIINSAHQQLADFKCANDIYQLKGEVRILLFVN